jgi:hypothetical protein
MNCPELAAAVIVAVVAASQPATHAIASGTQENPASGDCVTIGRPKPSTIYTYEFVNTQGVKSRTTQQWESVTEAGSRLRTTGPGGAAMIVNEHRIVGDVAVLDRTSKLGPGGGTIEATSFRPGMVMDPAFRACAGKSWVMPATTASFQSGNKTHSAGTLVGSMKIIALREPVTVPAGTFETVHYIRTSGSTDEYWKSIQHGVVVKHTSTIGANVITETLVGIK